MKKKLIPKPRAFFQRGGLSLLRRMYQGDPSLRLKNGSAKDDPMGRRIPGFSKLMHFCARSDENAR
jgi:hypothetical protein